MTKLKNPLARCYVNSALRRVPYANPTLTLRTLAPQRLVQLQRMPRSLRKPTPTLR